MKGIIFIVFLILQSQCLLTQEEELSITWCDEKFKVFGTTKTSILYKMGDRQCFPVFNVIDSQISLDSFSITTAHKRSNLFNYKSNGINITADIISAFKSAAVGDIWYFDYYLTINGKQKIIKHVAKVV
jgi:hypothetical protein